MTAFPLILASSSPFRRELLARLALPFESVVPAIDESPRPDETPAMTAVRLAEAKARAVAMRHPDALIIGSDQVAFLGQQIFGKPMTHDVAVSQLRMMSDQTVNFLTALCLYNAVSGRAHLRSVMTRVTFRPLSDPEIDAYLRKEQPYHCAGSAKSEGLGIALIARIEGDDPTALIGLPLIALCDLLRLENVAVL
ncbi:MAG: septum formation inhibitor Maf [Candidatus Accumulibacter sp.]|nr:septum formation inhibitor Maf [Accumulibacter sp.]